MRKKFRLLFLILILTFNFYGCGEKTIDTSPINNTGKTFIDSNLSNNFILSYKVETDGLKVNFIIDIILSLIKPSQSHISMILL